MSQYYRPAVKRNLVKYGKNTLVLLYKITQITSVSVLSRPNSSESHYNTDNWSSEGTRETDLTELVVFLC